LVEAGSNILNGVTNIFNACGAYDKDGSMIPRGSKKPEWRTALDFLEWYQLTLMPDFGIIIIDEELKGEYVSTNDKVYNIDAFNSASLPSSLSLATLLTVLMLSATW
jgi:hypothetical protein